MSHLVDDRVVADHYTKPTDSHQWLLPASWHPYSLALHIRRICSDNGAFQKRMRDLSEKLNKHGYQKQVIDQAIEKVKHMDRQKNLLSYKQKPTANKAVLPFFMTYRTHLPKFRGFVDKHYISSSSNHQIS